MIKHSVKVKDICQSGEEAINSIIRSPGESINPVISRMFLLERAADNLQDRLSLDITRGFFPTYIRQNLFRFLKHYDQTANYIKTGANDLNLMLRLKINLPEKISHLYSELLSINCQSANIINEMIQKLGIDDNLIITGCTRVGELEKIADQAYFKIKEYALNLGKSSTFSVMYLTLDVGRSLEMASDKATLAANYLCVIVKTSLSENSI
jgi:predicted phosphate transport protein (TIGR00153 family)